MNSSLHRAIESTNLVNAKRLISLGIYNNIQNVYGETPLHFAVIYQQLEIIKDLLKHNININQQCNYGLTALHLAVKHGNLDIIKILTTVKGGCADLNIQDNNAHIKCYFNNI